VAWDGALVNYALTEHAVMVVAVTSTQVLVNDPYFGRRWHTRTEFEAAYDTFDDMAVILR
jgi:predicted double-glycine peptidase